MKPSTLLIALDPISIHQPLLQNRNKLIWRNPSTNPNLQLLIKNISNSWFFHNPNCSKIVEHLVDSRKDSRIIIGAQVWQIDSPNRFVIENVNRLGSVCTPINPS